MHHRVRFALMMFTWLAAAPAAVYAQASITGVARDTSGAVLPGVTVEAASPALIEKVRAVVTDDAGQYRIVDLRPGTYTVTFTLPGFATVRREGIELAGSFVATLNAELRVGAVEETITVTGESPVVDVQSVQQQQIVSRDVIAALPTARAFLSLVTLNPSVVMSEQDVGGTRGPASGRYMSHGSLPTDSRVLVDGLGVASADGGGAAGSWWVPNVTASQEVVTTSSGGLGESETAGVTVNVIPREGGNTMSGLLFGTFATPEMQSDNYTDDLRQRGLRGSDRVSRNWDFTPALGGPLIQDKLWYFTYGRHMVADNYVAGMFHNKNAGDPNSWTYEPDLSRQAIDHGTWWSVALRLTAQASPRHKLTVLWDEQYRCARPGGCPNVSATNSPEAGSIGGRAFNDRVQQAAWTSPATNRLLLEAGFGTHILSWGGEAPDAFLRTIGVQEQAGAIPGLTYRGIGNVDRRGNRTYNWRSSLSYVSGTHNAKFGYRGSFYDYTSHQFALNGGLTYRFNNGVPNQLTQRVEDVTWTAHMQSHGVYAQDQWTLQRLTLQGGVRYDYWRSAFPASQLGPTPFVPVPIAFPAETGARFHDITPRMSAAYDLFGDGTTGVKVHLGKYVQGQESSAGGTYGSFMHPIRRLATTTSRSWNDANRNFVSDCDLANRAANGECGPIDNRRFATGAFSVTYDPEAVTGWGVRPDSWEFATSVQRELMPQVSATVGYFRRWFGNSAVTDNLATAVSDYTLFKLPVPVDSRLPSSGGVVTVATINPDKFGQVNNQVTAAKNFGEQTERWHGVDVTLNARLPNGVVAQGGLSTGSWLKDNCEVAPKLPEILGAMPMEFCRQDQPFQTQAKGFASYTVPRIDLQVGATWQNIPGPVIQANYIVPNAAIAPILGRNLAGNAANQTVGLLNFISQLGGNTPVTTPVDLAGDRLNQIDFRVAKLLRFGRTRTLVGVDLFNALNSSAITSFLPTYGPRWLTPTGIIQARIVKVSAQLDF
jgi:hypothetical protein